MTSVLCCLNALICQKRGRCHGGATLDWLLSLHTRNIARGAICYFSYTSVSSTRYIAEWMQLLSSPYIISVCFVDFKTLTCTLALAIFIVVFRDSDA